MRKSLQKYVYTVLTVVVIMITLAAWQRRRHGNVCL